MNDLIAAVSAVGFPIVVAFYLLVRFEAKITMLSKSIASLENTIQKLYIEKR